MREEKQKLWDDYKSWLLEQAKDKARLDWTQKSSWLEAKCWLIWTG